MSTAPKRPPRPAARLPLGTVQPTLLDRAIGYIAPREAARRLMARQQLAALSGGYVGARRDRAATASWQLPGGSPESDVIGDLPLLRERCADLERNAPVAAAIINTNAEHVVGTGLACTPQVDAAWLGLTPQEAKAWQDDTRRRFRAWAESPDCDLERAGNFYALQDLALRGALSRGDVFAITPRVPRNGRTRLAIQLLEADRVCNPIGRPNTATLTDGIEHDPNTGEAVSYHIASRHPGDITGRAGITWQAIAARGNATGRRNVLHVYRRLRPGLRRGVPVLAPVVEVIKQVTTYTDAELRAAVVSGLYAVFFKMDPEAFADLYAEDSRAQMIDKANNWSGDIQAGQAINLLPGEEPVEFNPGRPNEQFDPFLQACFTQIGMAVGLPREMLVMHFQSSYSAAKGALMLAWRMFMNRRDWLASTFCQPIYELWLSDEIAEGRIAAPGFFADDITRHAWARATWVGDGPGSLDPLKDANAAGARMDLGITALPGESLLYDGIDWETKHAQQVEVANARRAAGLRVHGDASLPATAAAPPQPDPQTPPDPQEP